MNQSDVDYYQTCLTGDCYEIVDDGYLILDMQMMHELFRDFHLKYASFCWVGDHHFHSYLVYCQQSEICQSWFNFSLIIV